jgi:phosphoribosylaminoimidazole-succinocarboxamide synthase
MGQPIPGKGELLTKMALFWFDKLAPKADIVPEPPDRRGARVGGAAGDEVRAGGGPLDAGASGCKPMPVEAVVRGYLAGSGWKEYRSQSVCGVPLPAGPGQRQQAAGADLHSGHQGRRGRARREHQLRAHGRADRSDLATRIRDVSSLPVPDGGRLCADQGHHHRRHQVRVRPGRRTARSP